MSSEDKPRRSLQEYSQFIRDNRESVHYVLVFAVFFLLIFAGDILIDLLIGYWPLVLGPLVGWYLARWAADNFYSPPGREVAVLDPENHTYRHVFIPEPVFLTMTQTGNNVVYHTPAGRPFYVARSLDLERKVIDYGWVHELDPQTVLSRESAFSKWDSTLNKVLVENLELMDHPHILGLGFARKSLRDYLDGFGRIVGFEGKDLEQHEGPEVSERRTGEIVGDERIAAPEEDHEPHS